jgi:hypothetical protein
VGPLSGHIHDALPIGPSCRGAQRSLEATETEPVASRTLPGFVAPCVTYAPEPDEAELALLQGAVCNEMLEANSQSCARVSEGCSCERRSAHDRG